MENFIRTYKFDKKLCDDLIKYYKNNKEYKYAGVVSGSINKEVKESIDVVFYNHSKNKCILKFFKCLGDCLAQYVNEFEIFFPLITETGNVIQYYPIGGGFKIFHHENATTSSRHRRLVYMLYLNNVPDGGTEFKYQNIILKAKKGDLVIWPAEFTHLHKGIISKTKEKYIATGWFNINA